MITLGTLVGALVGFRVLNSYQVHRKEQRIADLERRLAELVRKRGKGGVKNRMLMPDEQKANKPQPIPPPSTGAEEPSKILRS